jgi:hypothetical protein
MGGVIQVGYDASKVKEHMPNAVNIDDKGFMSVNYIQVLVAKVASLEKQLKQLQNGILSSKIKWLHTIKHQVAGLH